MALVQSKNMHWYFNNSHWLTGKLSHTYSPPARTESQGRNLLITGSSSTSSCLLSSRPAWCTEQQNRRQNQRKIKFTGILTVSSWFPLGSAPFKVLSALWERVESIQPAPLPGLLQTAVPLASSHYPNLLWGQRKTSRPRFRPINKFLNLENEFTVRKKEVEENESKRN